MKNKKIIGLEENKENNYPKEFDSLESFIENAKNNRIPNIIAKYKKNYIITVEDVLMETIIKFLNNYEPENHPKWKAYFNTICENNIKDFCRKEKDHISIDEPIDSNNQDGDTRGGNLPDTETTDTHYIESSDMEDKIVIFTNSIKMKLMKPRCSKYTRAFFTDMMGRLLDNEYDVTYSAINQHHALFLSCTDIDFLNFYMSEECCDLEDSASKNPKLLNEIDLNSESDDFCAYPVARIVYKNFFNVGDSSISEPQIKFFNEVKDFIFS